MFPATTRLKGHDSVSFAEANLRPNSSLYGERVDAGAEKNIQKWTWTFGASEQKQRMKEIWRWCSIGQLSDRPVRKRKIQAGESLPAWISCD
jgi:hypothetical protein